MKLDDAILLNVLLLLFVIDTYHHITLSRNVVILSQIIHIRIPHATPIFYPSDSSIRFDCHLRIIVDK